MGWHSTACGTKFYVDDWNDHLVIGRKWHLKGKYVAILIDGVQEYLHKKIATLKGIFGMVDHIDRNRMNNKEDNLRATTKSKNGANCGMSCNNTSGYRGVGWNKRANKYVAKIMFENKMYHLGYYINKEDAAYAWDLGAILFRGPDAPELNFPQNRESYIQELKENNIKSNYGIKTYLKKKKFKE